MTRKLISFQEYNSILLNRVAKGLIFLLTAVNYRSVDPFQT